MSTPSIPAPGSSSADATGAAADPAAPPGSVILEMRDITKEFPGVKALSNVSMAVRRGEIHAICGENGAGKSTLMKVLSGVYPAGSYDGEIVFEGRLCEFNNIRDSEARRHRHHPPGARAHPGAVDRREHLPRQRGGAGRFGIDWLATRAKRARAARPRRPATRGPTRRSANIGVGKQQLVEIAKALSKDVKLLILDEPTAALNEGDSQHLLDLLARSALQGRDLHHDQPQAQRDRADRRLHHDHPRRQVGRDAATSRRTASTRTASSAGWSVGRSSRASPTTPRRSVRSFFDVKNWTVAPPDASRTPRVQAQRLLRPSRRDRRLRRHHGRRAHRARCSLFGRSYGRYLEGTIEIKDGKQVRLAHRSQHAIDAGLAYVPEDRKTLGLNLLDSIEAPRSSARPAHDLAASASIEPPTAHIAAEAYRKSLQHPHSQRRRRGRQALRRQPAEGAARQVDVPRARPAHPRRADARHRRRRQVRDLRADPAPGRRRARASSSSPPSSPSCSAWPTGSTRSSRARSRVSLSREEADQEILMRLMTRRSVGQGTS